MTGGIISAVHRLTVERGGQRLSVVLRQYERGVGNDTGGAIRHEAEVLRQLNEVGLRAPEPLASCPDGDDVGGHPSILMTRLAGHVHLTPKDPDDWLRQIAATAARIHDASIDGPTFETWIDPERLTAPASSSRPRLWQAAIDVLRHDAGSPAMCFIHRDFQHFNFLWSRERLIGVVDWASASTGPAAIDVGHCRLNLAVLFGADWAERFRLAYEAETGRTVDPWWDLHALASYGDQWRQFIPIQVDGRAPVDGEGMTCRVEEVLAAALRRL